MVDVSLEVSHDEPRKSTWSQMQPQGEAETDTRVLNSKPPPGAPIPVGSKGGRMNKERYALAALQTKSHYSYSTERTFAGRFFKGITCL